MSEPKSEYKVEVKNLTKYFGDLHVLNDISFNVRKGEFICIVGPTGCGKTTFLNLLTRIYMPSKGDLLIDGESADPKKHKFGLCVSGAVLYSLEDGGGKPALWAGAEKSCPKKRSTSGWKHYQADGPAKLS